MKTGKDNIVWDAAKLSKKERRTLQRRAERDVKLGTFVVCSDGRFDSPELQGIQTRAVSDKGWIYRRCWERTADPRRRIPADAAAPDMLREKIKALEEAFAGLPEPETKNKQNCSAEEIIDRRRQRRDRAAKASELASARAELERMESDIEEAKKEIRQLENEARLEALCVETLSLARMNVYLSAAGRKAQSAVLVQASREALFSRTPEMLYAQISGEYEHFVLSVESDEDDPEAA